MIRNLLAIVIQGQGIFFLVRISYSPKSKYNHYKKSHKAFYLVRSLWKIFFLAAVFFIFRMAKSRFSSIFSSNVAEGWSPSERTAYVHFSSEYVFNALFPSISSFIDHRHLINLIFIVFTLLTIHLVLISITVSRIDAQFPYIWYLFTINVSRIDAQTYLSSMIPLKGQWKTFGTLYFSKPLLLPTSNIYKRNNGQGPLELQI